MELALFHQEYGYYARLPSQIGRSGDFFTSVSVGSLFGHLLALRAVSWWSDAGKPGRWRWTEIGAHSGMLAADALAALSGIDPVAARGACYTIIEPLASLRRVQAAALAHFGASVCICPSADDISRDPLPTFFVANEVLDALPFHVIRLENGEWRERCVALDSSGALAWTSATIDCGPLSDAISQLPGGLPEGYQTEVRTGLREFLSPYLRFMTHGRMVWIDYGFTACDYYTSGRSEGTLRTYRNHRAGSCPLLAPGEEDITAHVDFTVFARNAMALGAVPACFENQGTWLIRVAVPWLRSLEGNASPSLVRQFQTLTHPAYLGSKFHVLEIAWNERDEGVESRTARERLGIS